MIDKIKCTDEAATNHYATAGPDDKGTYTITESPHTTDTDHFYVWGHAVHGGTDCPVILCDPIIRNR